MNAKPATTSPPPIPGPGRNSHAADYPPGWPPLSSLLTRCPYCSPPRVYLGGLWVPLTPELAGTAFSDGICPLHLAEALGDVPSEVDPVTWFNTEPDTNPI